MVSQVLPLSAPMNQKTRSYLEQIFGLVCLLMRVLPESTKDRVYVCPTIYNLLADE